jgi:hypothetical protein
LVYSHASQSISFPTLPDVTYSSTPVSLAASASSLLPVTYSVVSGPATLSGNSLTLTGTGTVVVRASQSGNRNFTAAATADRSFTASPSFNSWKQSSFTPAELANPAKSGPTAIYGPDGVSNLTKYALGIDPKSDASAALPVLVSNSTELTYTYTRPSTVTDVTYVVEVSFDLAIWTSAGVTHELVSTAGTLQTWRGRYAPGALQNVFFRLKVTQNP